MGFAKHLLVTLTGLLLAAYALRLLQILIRWL